MFIQVGDFVSLIMSHLPDESSIISGPSDDQRIEPLPSLHQFPAVEGIALSVKSIRFNIFHVHVWNWRVRTFILHLYHVLIQYWIALHLRRNMLTYCNNFIFIFCFNFHRKICSYKSMSFGFEKGSQLKIICYRSYDKAAPIITFWRISVTNYSHFSEWS